ncbi:hypothetical protein VOLCADRAFT_99496 [Volvox carteri f. nagariensis]|uniref:Uncharacterized protein n=1 Tax=Volvox carteri f. nagariensis TaxID=3068 RepID=D8UHX8_VOLCA|nr:uncharacterized protein VOLCADRAFT_99496 [Volvox carteri f. nagariensis]EFJ40636.1 hypothetical protein VOLCADRAFT_99496 [Volvox carteri f. nagariensis]|eukprot:XP_002958262.1 hypothetical protein VOLCADRAFT_99496 [Volvox carteri f. nagariensis]
MSGIFCNAILAPSRPAFAGPLIASALWLPSGFVVFYTFITVLAVALSCVAQLGTPGVALDPPSPLQLQQRQPLPPPPLAVAVAVARPPAVAPVVSSATAAVHTTAAAANGAGGDVTARPAATATGSGHCDYVGGLVLRRVVIRLPMELAEAAEAAAGGPAAAIGGGSGGGGGQGVCSGEGSLSRHSSCGGWMDALRMELQKRHSDWHLVNVAMRQLHHLQDQPQPQDHDGVNHHQHYHYQHHYQHHPYQHYQHQQHQHQQLGAAAHTRNDVIRRQ